MSIGEYRSTERPSGRSRIYLSDPAPTESDDKAPGAVHKGSNLREWTGEMCGSAWDASWLLDADLSLGSSHSTG